MRKEPLMGKVSLELSEEIIKTFSHRKSPKEKSVRTTFTLTQKGDDALKYLTQAWDSKIKSIIDKLCKAISEGLDSKNESVWDMIFEGIKDGEYQDKREIRKTAVLSEKSLSILNALAKKHSISRDMILDLSFQSLAFWTKNSTETMLKNHKKVLSMIAKLWRDAEAIETQAQKILDKDDPILERIGTMIVLIMNLSEDLEREQKNGTPINPNDM